MTPDEQVAENLRGEVRARGLTVRDLAAACGWTVNYTQRRLAGTSAISAADLALLADRLAGAGSLPTRLAAIEYLLRGVFVVPGRAPSDLADRQGDEP